MSIDLALGIDNPALRSCVIVRRDGHWCLLTRDRSRTLGCHDTYREAAAQEKAIEISKARRGAAYNPDQPRDPKGTPTGGQWTSDTTHSDIGEYDQSKTNEAWEKVHGFVPGSMGSKQPSDYKREQMIENARRLRKKVSDEDIEVALKTYDPHRSLGSHHFNEKTEKYEEWTDETAAQARAEMLVNSFTSTWASSSGDHTFDAVVYQHAVAEEFGLDADVDHMLEINEARRKFGVSKEDGEALHRVMRAHARAQYENTQRAIANGPDEWTLVRGFITVPEGNTTIKGRDLEPLKSDLPELRTGHATLQPISSFSTSRSVALGFGRPGGGTVGVMITTRVHKSRIFSMPKTGFGCFDEREVLVLGGRIRTSVTVSEPGNPAWKLLTDGAALLRDAEWDESKHPRHPAGSDKGGEFASVEFPFADDYVKGSEEAKSHYDTDRSFRDIHGVDLASGGDDPFDGRVAGKMKHGVSMKLAGALDAEFDREKLDQLAVLLGTDTAGRSGGYSVSAAFVNQWAMSSGDHDPLSVLYQYAANDAAGADGTLGHFGHDGADIEGLEHILGVVNDGLGLSGGESHGITSRDVYDMMRVHARAQYDETQRVLAAKGVKEVSLWRGVSIDPDDAATIARTGVVALQPLSSFSSNRGVALDFASQKLGDTPYDDDDWTPAKSMASGHLLRMTLPASRVFSIPKTGFGCLNEFEWVILGNKSTSTRISKRYGSFKKVAPFKVEKIGPLSEKDALAAAYNDDPEFIPFSEAYGEFVRYLAWNEADHPRDDDGRWVSTGAELGTVYHGGKTKITAVDPGRLQSRDYGFYGEGFYVTSAEHYARAYGNKVSKFDLDPDATVLMASLKPEDAPAGLVDEVVADYRARAWDRAVARGKVEALEAELSDVRTDPLAWKSAVSAYAKRKDFAVVHFSPGEIVVRHHGKLRQAKEWDESKHPREPKGDDDGGQFTSVRGRATRGEMRPATAAERKKLGVPPAYTDVQITDDPNAELRATARNSKNKLVSYYSEEWDNKQAAKKWARIQELNDAMPDMLKRVNKDIANETDDRDVAMTIRLIAQTGLRNGNEEGKGTGASRLLLDHVTLVGGGKVRLQFVGKGGVAQDHTVDDKSFAAYVRERMKTSDDGRLFPHTADDTLDYMKRIGGGRFIVHDLRTYTGTTLASKFTQELITKGAIPSTERELKAAVKDIATRVSKRLGNTPAVALKKYIHPASIAPLSAAMRKRKAA